MSSPADVSPAPEHSVDSSVDSPVDSAVDGSAPDVRRVRPRLGIQGPVVAWQDPWAGDASDDIMRTGTGVVIPSQDPRPTPEGYLRALTELGAEFTVHHVIPGAEHDVLLQDHAVAGIDLVLGNEYGNINGPYVDGTNRWDVPTELVRDAAAAGVLAGVLYDEPEHVQMHASQYRKDAFLPHFGDTTGLDATASLELISGTVRGIVADAESAAPATPVLAEHVFPILFHTLARAGMTPAPKVMKESFQPLQLASALGAAVQYRRDLWICADLWGPDIGQWLTRAPGFPGHSPAEFASALRLAYLFSPSHLFVENVDGLLRHRGDDDFARTEHGEVWREFVRSFVPTTPLHWRFDEARADVVLIHAEDGNYGGGHQPFGNRDAVAPDASRTVFEAWHLLSGGSMPAHGSCMHIEGYDFPRHRLNEIPRPDFPVTGTDTATLTHPLFHAAPNVLVFDETVDDVTLGDPGLILVVGSRLPAHTHDLLRRRATAGATVAIASWLTAADTRRTERLGDGAWLVFDDLLDAQAAADVHAAISARTGSSDVWRQRFGDVELRITPGDATGETLAFEVARD